MGERRTAGDTRDVGRTLTARVGAVLSTWVTSRCSTLPDRAQRWGCVWEQSVRTTTIARSLSNNGSLVAGCPQKAATSPTPFSTCAPAPSASLSSSTGSTRLTRWTLLTRGTLGGGRFGLARWWSCGPPLEAWAASRLDLHWRQRRHAGAQRHCAHRAWPKRMSSLGYSEPSHRVEFQTRRPTGG